MQFLRETDQIWGLFDGGPAAHYGLEATVPVDLHIYRYGGSVGDYSILRARIETAAKGVFSVFQIESPL